MRTDIKVFIKHILESISLIEQYTTTISKEEFFKSRQIQDAVIRRLEIIGEACRNISRQTRESHPEVEWSGAIGTRDRVLHQYFRIDFDVVWNVLKKDLPALKKQMERIKKELADK